VLPTQHAGESQHTLPRLVWSAPVGCQVPQQLIWRAFTLCRRIWMPENTSGYVHRVVREPAYIHQHEYICLSRSTTSWTPLCVDEGGAVPVGQCLLYQAQLQPARRSWSVGGACFVGFHRVGHTCIALSALVCVCKCGKEGTSTYVPQDIQCCPRQSKVRAVPYNYENWGSSPK
jgi:hypothetical protein